MPAEQPELERSAARATLRGGDAASNPDLPVYREAEAELQRQREWFRVTLASIGDAVITTDSQARVTFLNPVAEALTGWTSAAAMGQPVQIVFRVIDEQTRESFDHVVARVLREQRVVTLANRCALIAKNGREIPIEDSAAPILDAAGSVLGVVLVFHDVAEKRNVQDALHASEERYRTVAEFTYDWEYWRGPDDRFLYISASCERITGYRQDEFLEDAGLYLRIIHPDDRERVAAHLRDDLPHRDLRELEFRIVRRDGQVRWIGHACQLVVGTSGQPMGRRACNRDITPRKELEAELRQANDQLEAEIVARTQAAEELRAGNEELQRFNRAMVGRELRMIELKREVNELCARAGQPPRYREDFDKYPR